MSAEPLAASTEVRLWSVTYLIKEALGMGEGLFNWVARITATGAVDKRPIWEAMLQHDGRDAAIEYLTKLRFQRSEAAKLRGTELHGILEAIALGKPFAVPAGGDAYVAQLVKWVDEFRPRFVMSEAPVYNVEQHYAGTLDGIIELPTLPGENVIYDLKTTEYGPDHKGSRPPYPEVALQMCAYAHATEVGVIAEQRYSGRGRNRYYIYDERQHHEPMPRVDRAICIVLSPYDCFAVPVRIDDDVWKAFRHARELARFKLAHSQHLFGGPLEPMTEALV